MGCTLTTEEVTHIDRTIAALKSENDGYAGQLTRLTYESELLRSENAKLRELVRRMARALGVGGEWCDRDCGAEFGCDLTDCPIEREMRELGVEP